MEERGPTYSRGEDTWLLYSEATTEGAPNVHKGALIFWPDARPSSLVRSSASQRTKVYPLRGNWTAKHIHVRRKCVLFLARTMLLPTMSFSFSLFLFFYFSFFFFFIQVRWTRSQKHYKTQFPDATLARFLVEGGRESRRGVERRDPRRSMRVFRLDINRPRAAGGKPLVSRGRKPVQLIFANPADHPSTGKSIATKSPLEYPRVFLLQCFCCGRRRREWNFRNSSSIRNHISVPLDIIFLDSRLLVQLLF